MASPEKTRRNPGVPTMASPEKSRRNPGIPTMASPERNRSGLLPLPVPPLSLKDKRVRSRVRQYLVLACGGALALVFLSSSLVSSPALFTHHQQDQQLADHQQQLPPSSQQRNSLSTSPAWSSSIHLKRALQSLAHTLLLCGQSSGTGSLTAFHTTLCGPWPGSETSYSDSDSDSRGDKRGNSGSSSTEERAQEQAQEPAEDSQAHWLPLRWKPEEDEAEEAEIDFKLPKLPDKLDTGFKAPPSEDPTASNQAPADESTGKDGASQTLSPSRTTSRSKRRTPKAHIPTPLVHHVGFPGPAQCGEWASDYARLHDEIRQSSVGSDQNSGSGSGSGNGGGQGVRRKYVTYESTLYNPGLGDRLVGLVSTFLVALLTRRAFIMADPFLAAVFEPAEVDWRVRTDVPMPVTSSSMSNISEGCVLRVYALNGERSGIFPVCPECRGMVPDIVENFEGTEPAANIVIHINRGVLTEIFTKTGSRTRERLEEMGLQHKNAFACILRFLMRPRREILELAARPAQALLRPKAWSICLHLRTDDNYAWPSPERFSNDSYMAVFRDRVEAHLAPLLQCAQRLEDHHGKVIKGLGGLGSRAPTWFVMSDAGAVTSSMVRRYGKKVLTSGFITKHPKLVGINGMISSAVEWLLFSACNFYVTVESGLSKTAYAYNLHAPPLFMIDRLDIPLNVHRECDLSKPLDISDLGNWSGL